MIRAAVFDLDGLLVDSEPWWRRVQMEVMGELGVPLTEEMCAETTGMRIDTVVAHWFEKHPWAGIKREEVVDRIVDRVVIALRTEGEAKAGVMHAVTLASSLDLTLAVASSSHHRIISAALERLGIRYRFGVICSGETEAKGKPDPAIYFTAAKRLSMRPEECVALEDSLPGFQAAKAAGMRVIVVPEAPSPDFADADVRLSSLADLTREHLFGAAS